MNEEKMLLSKYVMVFRMWAESYENNIKRHGFTTAFNNKIYKSLKDFHEDVEKQLQDYWAKDILVKDVPFEDALSVLCGKNNVYELPSFKKAINE